MSILGYHCSHEQYSPSQLLSHVRLAAQAGFTHAMCSDHFHPWSENQGQSGFAWSWLGAALEATSLSFGTVNAPGQRYHPAIIAQAAATLAEMYPERFWLAVGSGEALNETITGEEWAPKEKRNCRLKECVDVMRALWSGQTVNHQGLITVRHATLYSRPVSPPPVIAACLSVETARWAGAWADGMVTVSQDRRTMKNLVDAFKENGGEGKPIFLQVVLSYAPTDAEAAHTAHEQWRQAGLQKEELGNLDSVLAFDQATQRINIQDIGENIRISSSTAQHLDWFREDVELGFDRLYLHNVHQDQHRFLSEFAEHVVPALVF